MSKNELSEMAGDFAVAMESLSQVLKAVASLKPDLQHSFLQQAAECRRVSDRWLSIYNTMTQGSDK
jgi:hypothetical protein